jgi:competence protein ComEA
MIRKLFAALLAFVASAALAAVDINKATQADLESIKGIGPVISTKILDERKKGGPFKDWNDVLTRVKGIGEGNASKFSADGLTVNDKAYRPATASTTKDAKVTAKAEADAKPDKKADAKVDAKVEKNTAAPSAPAATKAAASAPAGKK